MEECLILVDNSNVFIEGRKFSSRKKGMSELDWSWRIDFGSLLKEVANDHKIIKSILVGSTPPPNDSLWNAAKLQGFEVKTHTRSHSTGEEKAVDTELLASGLKVIYKHPRPAILKLLSGDRDFIPLIRSAYEEGWETELWGFSSSISNELAQTVSRVRLLDAVFDQIGKYES
ncbi:MAG: NYN domain-containing protein [Spirochaetia bacterium]|jgi:uncharacterized LabA/DUF88 family protein|nr:NYN domain-containing protein [Spirochaetia bacterium]